MLQGLISCFQLLHEVVSLSKCCSREYSRCDRKVSSHNRPCPELLPASVRVGAGRWRDHGDHANTHLITRAWHHRHGQESDNERTWDRILGQAGHSHPGQIQSQLSRMERREDIGILVRSHCHLHYRGRPGPRHIMTLDARYNMNFMHSGEFDRGRNLGSEKDLLEQPGGDIFHINSTGGSLVLNPSQI